MPSEVIEGIKDAFSSPNYKISMLPKKGGTVEINKGPMAGLNAVFLEPNGLERSFLLVKILGSNKRIDVYNSQFS